VPPRIVAEQSQRLRPRRNFGSGHPVSSTTTLMSSGSRSSTRFCQEAGVLIASRPRQHQSRGGTFGLTRRSRRGRAPLRTRLPASCPERRIGRRP
jgi:hypothetical protein